MKTNVLNPPVTEPGLPSCMWETTSCKNMILFGDGVFATIIKQRIWRRGPPR